TKHDVATPGTAVCSVCHIPRDPKGQALWAGPPNQTARFSGIKPLCFSCHDGTVAAADYTYVFDPARPEHPLTPGARGQDCDRCHDAHRERYGKFIKLPGGANFCQSCHPRAGPADHPVDINPRDVGVAPLDSDWSPNSGDFSGTRLWDSTGQQPGGLVKCLTCHSPHGGQPSTQMNTLPFLPTHNSALSLCQSCHPRGGAD
ncbi:MAG TPA: cytochrome c3 family protein, partial [Dehalococcoidia bacterium]|nr:cytochrome c3 family protein [Dehalococcoidia bacterium]